jgi:hypothetical protein|tara:strand:- start:90 stop:1520 length:1431 start_codon:yes stop_codon:yes gene_type:complete
MPATLELKYFNSFWLKKMKNIVDAAVKPTPPYANIPAAFAVSNGFADDWYIEEARIRGGYNNTIVDLGVKAYLAEQDAVQETRIASLIYSGLFNSRTGVNNTNQFSVGKDITKSVNPANGSIQRLYAEDTNLIIFQEDKVSRALIDKDAIYSAEGNASITSSQQVIGQIIAYAGEYGISTNPESFAVYGYRKYFTDVKRNAVLRLSKDGMTEISSYGMHDFFRDELSNVLNTRMIGGWDMHTKNYILSIQQANPLVDETTSPSYKTVVFDENVLGWSTFLSFRPRYMFSIGANFYSIKDGLSTDVAPDTIYRHYTNTTNNSNLYGNFYGSTYDSNVTLVLNANPSVVKNFKTINYEGTNGWELDSMKGLEFTLPDTSIVYDQTLSISSYTMPTTMQQLQDDLFSNEFKRKENKYFANLINNSVATQGEVVFGQSSTGIKGFFATVKMKIPSATLTANPGTKYELFSVASDISQSSY